MLDQKGNVDTLRDAVSPGTSPLGKIDFATELPNNGTMKFGRSSEVLAWIGYMFVSNLVGATSVLFERAREGSVGNVWEPFVWEYSSGIAMLLLIPVILWLDKFRPLRPGSWKSALIMHAIATIPFSLIHVFVMVWLRKLVYWLNGSFYDFGNVPVELIYEYRKDLLSYFFVLGAIYAYRMFRANMTGAHYEGSSGDSPDARIFVKKRGQIHRIPPDSVDWIEAAGNYVILHVGESSHPLRDTMTGIASRLGEDFCRVHRSTIVNLNRVIRTSSAPGGDLVVHLRDGTDVRCSRTARSDFEHRLAAQAG